MTHPRMALATIAGVILAASACSSAAKSDLPAAAPTSTARPVSSSQSAASQPTPSITEASIPGDPATARTEACSIWSTVLKGEFAANIHVNDLAPLIRITMGIEPDSTTGQQDPSQPWPTFSTDASVVGDPLNTDVSALDEAVTQASPTDLSSLTAAADKITQDCS